MILNQGGVLHYLGVHKTPRVLNSSCTTLNFLDVQTLQQFIVFILHYFHVTRNSSFFRAILRFKAAPSIVISSTAVVTRASIGRTILPVMRRYKKFAFHYFIILRESSFLDFVVSTSGSVFFTASRLPV